MGAAIGISVGIFVLIIIAALVGGKRRDKLIQRGLIRKRDRKFWMQESIFHTSVPSLRKIFEKMDKGSFQEFSIACKMENDKMARFWCDTSEGRANIVISAEGKSDRTGKNLYSCQATQYTSRNDVPIDAHYLAINIVLTQVEKAILLMDFDSMVQRRYNAFK